MTVSPSALVLVIVLAASLDGAAFGGDPGPALVGVRAELVAVRNAQGRPRGAAARRERAAVVGSIRRLRSRWPHSRYDLSWRTRHLGNDLRSARDVLRRLDRGFPLGIDPGSDLGASLAALRAELADSVGGEIATIARVATSEPDDAARAAVLAELDMARSALDAANAAPSDLAAVELLRIADARNVAAAQGLPTDAGDLTFLLASVSRGAEEASGIRAHVDGTGTLQITWYGPVLDAYGSFETLAIRLGKLDAGPRTASSNYSENIYLEDRSYSPRCWGDLDTPVTITLHDPRARLISGTFAFVLPPLNPGITPITFEQGTFALHYAPN